MKQAWRVLLAWVAVQASVWLMGGSARAQKPPPPELQRIFDDWQARQKAIQSVRYVVHGQHITARGVGIDPATQKPLVPPTPAHDIISAKNLTLLLDFATGRFRQETDEEVYNVTKGGRYRQLHTHTFDGKQLQGAQSHTAEGGHDFTPGRPLADVSLTSGNLNFTVFDAMYDGLFFGHGIVPTSLNSVGCGPKMRVQPDAEMFYIRGRSRYKNHDCVVVRTHPVRMGRTTGFDEMWVDPQRAGAVLRLLSFINKQPWIDTEVTYKKTAYGWLTSEWTYTVRSAKTGRVESIDRLTVTDVTVNPPFDDSAFKVDIRPGMVVSKAVIGGRPDGALRGPTEELRFYHVGEDGQLHLVETAIAPPHGGLPAYVWFAISVIGAVLLLLAYVGFRKAWWRPGTIWKGTR